MQMLTVSFFFYFEFKSTWTFNSEGMQEISKPPFNLKCSTLCYKEDGGFLKIGLGLLLQILNSYTYCK